MAAAPELVQPVEQAIDLLLDVLAPWIGRLRRIKAAYDPGDPIRSNQPVNRQL